MTTITITQIAQLLGVSERTVRDRWVHDPDFPPPDRHLCPRHVGAGPEAA